MGMPIVLDVRDPVSDELVEAVFDWFREVDERFSTYKDGSEISRLNRGELAVRDCHPGRALRSSRAATSFARRRAGTSMHATSRFCPSIRPGS